MAAAKTLIAIGLIPIWLSIEAVASAPVISIDVGWSGHSATEVDAAIAPGLSMALNLPQIRQVEIISRPGRCSAVAYLASDAVVHEQLQRIVEHLAVAIGRLPPTCQPPTLVRGDPDALAQYWIALQSDRLTIVELSELAEQKVAPHMAQLVGVSKAQVIGAAPSVPTLWLDLEKLTAFGMTAGDVRTAMVEAFKPQAGAQAAAIFDVNSLGDVIVKSANGAAIRARDVARVAEEVHQDAVAELDGRRGVFVALTVEANKFNHDAFVKELQKLQGTLPEAVQISIAADLSREQIALVEITKPADISAQRSAQVDRGISEALRSLRDVITVLTIPTDEPQTRRVLVRSQKPQAAIDELRRRLSKECPSAHFRFCLIGGSASAIPFSTRIALVGPDRKVLKRWADATLRRLAPDTRAAPVTEGPTRKIEIDDAARARLSLRDISDYITLADGGAMTFPLPTGKPAEIRLPTTGDPTSRLAQLTIRNDRDERIPLSAVAKVTSEFEPTALLRVGAFPGILITATADGEAAQAVTKCPDAAKQERAQMKLEAEYRVIDLTDNASAK